MKNFIYVFYNNLSKRYGNIVCFPSDGFALARVQPTIPKEELSEIELCRVGSIDVNTGIVESEPPVRIAWKVEVEKLPVVESVKSE